MNLDTLIREANPAPLAAQPDADSPFGRAIAAQVAATPLHAKRRPVVALAGLVAVAVVGVLVVALLPGSPGRPTSAAAAVLRQVATAAAGQDPLRLGPGRYLYSETSSLTVLGELGLTTGRPVYATYKTDSRFWEAADGSARIVNRNIGPVRFTTRKSKANWVTAGSPAWALRLPPYTINAADTTEKFVLPAEFRVPPLSVSKLPTVPSALLAALEHGVNTYNPAYGFVAGGFEWNPNPDAPISCWATVSTSGTSRFDVTKGSCTTNASLGMAWNGAPPHSAAIVFQEALELLGTPATGTTPALRSALYQVIANLKGVMVLGQETDRRGRIGAGVASPTYDGLRLEAILDKSTGALLQVEQVVAKPSQEVRFVKTYFGSAAGQVLGWTDYLSSGVVDSTTATP
jgi:hypothetical protein